ncbi:hypothetical protein BDV12DRAFT_200894 [Aspergillus spectabilis]
MLHIENVPPDAQLTLRNGQHRVRALVELCDEQGALGASGAFDESGKPIGPPGKEDYLWAVDLYDNDQFKPDTLTTLISNRDVVRKTNSEGYNALNIITYLDQLDNHARAKRLKAGNFKQWLYNVFGVNLTYTTRMITILKDRSLSKLIRLYCGTRYGENSFNWSLMARIQAEKQTEMWKLKFKKFFTFCSTIFGAKYQNLIAYDDWKLILSLDQGRPISQLRLLFFPKPEDYWVQFTDGSTQKRKQPLPISDYIHIRGYADLDISRMLQEYALSVRVSLGERSVLPTAYRKGSMARDATLVFQDRTGRVFNLVIRYTGQHPNSHILTMSYPESICKKTSRILVSPTLQILTSNTNITSTANPNPNLSDQIFAVGDIATHPGPLMARASFMQAEIIL